MTDCLATRPGRQRIAFCVSISPLKQAPASSLRDLATAFRSPTTVQLLWFCFPDPFHFCCPSTKRITMRCSVKGEPFERRCCSDWHADRPCAPSRSNANDNIIICQTSVAVGRQPAAVIERGSSLILAKIDRDRETSDKKEVGLPQGDAQQHQIHLLVD
ncbi:hypothetical protein ONS96_004705 [Cadophora gregata f. sp. sojae]|nr:hypothetical protein ONS96_004705 [Cadophora gregata f. sp. sojae]